jgi:hypothetical protein
MMGDDSYLIAPAVFFSLRKRFLDKVSCPLLPVVDGRKMTMDRQLTPTTENTNFAEQNCTSLKHHCRRQEWKSQEVREWKLLRHIRLISMTSGKDIRD